MKHSKNLQAKKIVGLRKTSRLTINFDRPSELGYRCPVCKGKSLQWSEYNGFVWCEECNSDYPSCLCVPDIEKAIQIYLDCISEAKKIKPKFIKNE